MIEQHDPEIPGQARHDQAPHVLVTAEPVGQHHHRAVVAARQHHVVPAAHPDIAHTAIFHPPGRAKSMVLA